MADNDDKKINKTIETKNITQQTISDDTTLVKVYNPNRFQVMFIYDGEYTAIPPKCFTNSNLILSKLKLPLPCNLQIEYLNRKEK